MAFHCDSDYFGFLKFFLLLTEVKPTNGPFTFVGGSHRGKRHVVGRMKDKEIISDHDEVLYGTGEPGDLIIADTRGWHKATPPEQGTRTMLQVLHTTSLFGQPS
jgi:ectoine hydroxylase-related dioxygenase (phytanoyl-CoA dioxygenase family)